MWNISGGILASDPIMGLNGFKKSTFPTVAFPVLNIGPGKTFSNPNFVNKSNPSVLNFHRSDTFDSTKPTQNELTKTDNFSTITPQKEVNSSQQQQTESTNPEPEPVKTNKACEQPVMCNKATRKRSRRRRKTRRKNKSAGKHSKSNDKEIKHSKHAEQEQIIREEMLLDECDFFAPNVKENESETTPIAHHKACLFDFLPPLEIISVNCNIDSTNKDKEIKHAEQEQAIREDMLMDECDFFAPNMKESEQHKACLLEIISVNCNIDSANSKSICFTVCPPNNISRLPRRERQVSIAESEDSFIVFDSDSDELDFNDDSTLDESDDDEYESDVSSASSVIPCKRVRFAESARLCEVHPMIQWSYAYQAARKGPWEEYARDRERFKKRINDSEPVIGDIFNPQHRLKVYNERFNSVQVPMEV